MDKDFARKAAQAVLKFEKGERVTPAEIKAALDVLELFLAFANECKLRPLGSWLAQKYEAFWDAGLAHGVVKIGDR